MKKYNFVNKKKSIYSLHSRAKTYYLYQMTNIPYFKMVTLFAWVCKYSGGDRSFSPRNVMFQNMLNCPSRDKPKLPGWAPSQSKCSCNSIKIWKTTIWIVAACTRTACMFICLSNQSPIFPHLLQKYFYIYCRNISPSLAKIFFHFFQKYFSTSCLDFHHLHPLAPPPLIYPCLNWELLETQIGQTYLWM